MTWTFISNIFFKYKKGFEGKYCCNNRKFVTLNIIQLTVNGWRVIFPNTNHEVVSVSVCFTSFDISLHAVHFSSTVINLSKNGSTLWQLTGDEQILTGQRNSSLTIRVKCCRTGYGLKQIRGVSCIPSCNDSTWSMLPKLCSSERK